MSAVHALERILDITVDPAVRLLRRLIYLGEWIESHALHVFMLHAPDFLGFPDAIRMAAEHRELVELALRLKKIGNHLMIALGGREIHRSEEHTSELQSLRHLVCRLLLEKKKIKK